MPAYNVLVPDEKKVFCDEFFTASAHGEWLVEKHPIGDYQAS
jgi:hypothetical protein